MRSALILSSWRRTCEVERLVLLNNAGTGSGFAYLERGDEAAALDDHLPQLKDLVAQLGDGQATTGVCEESRGHQRGGSRHRHLVALVENPDRHGVAVSTGGTSKRRGGSWVPVGEGRYEAARSRVIRSGLSTQLMSDVLVGNELLDGDGIACGP